ncbi:ATP-dependent RNA helicase DDX19A-like [Bolinopsis microptera]|uniref:ATP-dependent RNA helicase DDX19A-like n=1 Tax=Bolinopsis microptera TaxID=2820187 RepID=UPI003079BA05
MADWANLLEETDVAIAKEVDKIHITEDSNKSEEPTPPAPAAAAVAAAAVATENTPENPSEDPEKLKAENSFFTKVLRSQLVESKTEVEIQQRDPNSPLYSVKTFEELKLKTSLLEGVYGMGFNKPSKIQETALPMLMCDPPQNMIAQSQSGTGKTAAFVLATLSRIDEAAKYPQALILAPTYELALQIGEVLQRMASRTEIVVEHAIRGKRYARGTRIGAHIIVGTPGTTVDWVFKLKFFDPRQLRVFVLDEADVMVSQQGHQEQSIRIKKTLDPRCQCLLFSATYEEDVMRFAQTVIPDPILIKLKREEQSLDTIKQFYVMCNNESEKYESLCNIYGTITIGQTMIFCKMKTTATWLLKKMAEDGHAVAMLTSDISIEDRLVTLNRFREGREKVLITTNVCARGIDIEQVTVVINFDLPIVHGSGTPDMETYLHRIGRTGRFGKKGIAINFVDNAETLRMIKQIQNYFNKEIVKLNTDDSDEIEGLVC